MKISTIVGIILCIAAVILGGVILGGFDRI
jgi:flagellar motor component MotA